MRYAVLALMLCNTVSTFAQSDKYIAGCIEKHRWKESECRRLYRHEIWTRMTSEMAAESLGQPINSNLQESLGKGGTSQIVYHKWSFTGMSKGTVTLSYDSKLCKTLDDPGARMANIYSPNGKRVKIICVVTGIEVNDIPSDQGMRPRLPQ
jgi:hypothetical protein